MNRALVLGIGLFLAVVGFTALSVDGNPAQAGGCCGCGGYSSCCGCHGGFLQGLFSHHGCGL